MYSRNGQLLGIIAALAVIGCFMAGCGDADGGPTGGGGGGSNNGGDGGGSYLISGAFASQTGTGNALFYADYVSNARSVSRAVGGMAATEKELTGKIEDGDIIFNLKGVYNTADNKFYLSAGSSFLVYQIAGTLTNGALSATEAAVKIKSGSGNDWEVRTIAVTTTDDVEIAGGADTEQEDGIPSAWFGEWNIEGMDGTVIITSYQYLDSTTGNKPNGLIDFHEDIAGQKYSMIFQQVGVWIPPAPVGVGEEPDEGHYSNVYIWITAEADGENLKIAQHRASSYCPKWAVRFY